MCPATIACQAIRCLDHPPLHRVTAADRVSPRWGSSFLPLARRPRADALGYCLAAPLGPKDRGRSGRCFWGGSAQHSGSYLVGRPLRFSAPTGRSDNSPARKGWVTIRQSPGAPTGRHIGESPMPQSLASLHLSTSSSAPRTANRSSPRTWPRGSMGTSAASLANRLGPHRGWRNAGPHSPAGLARPAGVRRGPGPRHEIKLVGLGPRHVSRPVAVLLAVRVRGVRRQLLDGGNGPGVHREPGEPPPRRTFQDEFRKFLKAHEIEWDERYVWD